MKVMKEDLARRSDHVLDLCSAVEELHGLSSKEMNKLLRDSDNFTLRLNTGKGSTMQIDMESLAGCLPLHLLAVLVSSNEGEVRLRYLLRGVRLLHSLSELASRHAKLEQILLEEVKITEQILDLVFYMLLVLARFEQEGRIGSFLTLQHAALVACSFHLLTAFVSPQWQDLVNVLLAHPKVDIFMEAAFDAVRKDIIFFQLKLRTLNTKLMNNKTTFDAAERIAQTMSKHCEASLQALHSLCLQKLFRERLLRNKELCKNGGVLSFALSVLKFQVPSDFMDSSNVTASVSRLKSKVLSMLLQLCETENFSYLDEVASSPRSMCLAVSVASEVLDLLKITLHKDPKELEGSQDNHNPRGLVVLNSMRLVDIFSDDSNFRTFIMDKITQDLAEISALPPGEFSSSWCAVDSQALEEDATFVYDPFRAAGAAMISLKGGGSASSGPAAGGIPDEAINMCSVIPICTATGPHSQQRTAFLVKIFANLHCYVPDICKEQEKNQFFNKFLECLTMGPLNSASWLYFLSEAQTAVRICENLCTLWDHAIPLLPVPSLLNEEDVQPPSLLNEEDVQLLSDFLVQLHQSICPEQPRNGTIKEEPMVEYVREKHDKKFKGMFQKHQQEYWTKSYNNTPEHSEKTQINTGISIDKDIENHPSAQKNLEKDGHQTSEEAQSTGGYRPSSQRNQEGTAVEESMSLHETMREPEENYELKDANKTLQMGDIQEVDQFKESETEHTNLMNAIADIDENRNEGINSNTRSEVESAAEIDHEDNMLEFRNNENSIAADKGYFDELLRESEENQNLADGEKEDEAAGVMSQASERVDTSIGEDKQPKKRKRNVMNDKQIALIENALQDEPEMQRSAPLLQLWTEKLRDLGSSDLTTSQLKNWLNNRKARLARAARESRTPDGENMMDKLGLARSSPAISGEHPAIMGSFYESPESNNGEDFYGALGGPRRGNKSARFSTPINSRSSAEDLHGMSTSDFDFSDHARVTPSRHCAPVRFVQCEVGQFVSLRNDVGEEVAQGIVFQVEGIWHGRKLDEQGLCVVEIKKLSVERWARLPHPSDISGNTFEEAESLNSKMLVVWDTHKIFLLPSNVQD